MRPVKLILCAFGPFADEQVLDFRDLGDTRAFLIHGPTGAGKTSILDGICFALFGKTSGGERDGGTVRSDHAEPGEPTSVTLDFTLRDRDYRVFRSPEQDRPAKRGEGTVAERPKATLWDRTDCTDESEEGVVLADGWKRVTEKVEALMGFLSEQFRQVVVLPQGKFRQFLEAGSAERERILEALFETGTYHRIQEALKRSFKDAQHRLETLSTRRAEILAQARAGSLEELRRIVDQASTRLGSLREELEALRGHVEQAQQKLEKGSRAKQRLDELEKAAEELAALDHRKDTVRSKEQQLEAARSALPLLELDRTLNQRRNEGKDAERAVDEARRTLTRAKQEQTEAASTLEREERRRAERDEARRKLDDLHKMKDKVAQLNEAEQALTAARNEAGQLDASRQEKNQRLEQIQDNRAGTLQAREAAQTQAGQLKLREEHLGQAREALERSRRLVQLRDELKNAQNEYDLTSEQLAELEKTVPAAAEKLSELERAQLEGQAVILAEQLKDGAACPVCGSTEHPSPAHSDRKPPSESSIKKARKALDDIRSNKESAYKEAGARREKLLDVEKSIEFLQDSLADPNQAEPSALEKKVAEAQAALEHSNAARTRLDALVSELDKLEQEEAGAKKEVEAANEALENARAKEHKAEGAHLAVEQELPESLRTATALEQAVEQADSACAKLEKALEHARSRSEAAGRALAAATEGLARAEKALAAATERSAETEQQFHARLADAGFKDPSEFEAARLSRQAMQELETDIREFSSTLKAAAARHERARKDTESLEPPDLDSLQRNHSELKAKVDQNNQEQGALGEQLAQAENCVKQLAEITAETGALEKQFGVIGRISEVANGRNNRNMTFQRFVLSTLLDEVLAQATVRLRQMSHGRFRLRRAHEQKDGRFAGGLDLMAFDEYTGTDRPVSTLSGGEGFLAALSLALGLADVVQSFAGGLRLDTIFVDEGFGSLDPELLDSALKTLMDQSAGKLTGIISHVPVVKEHINARLEVTAGRRGSTARFVT